MAIAGCGAVSQVHHLPALARSRTARAVALVDRDLDRARGLAERFAVPRVAASLAEVAAGVDAVIVALPNHLHCGLTLEALERGLHVLVEKPMALDVAEAASMVAAARERGRILAVGTEFRFVPAYSWVRQVLAAGWLGRPRHFEMRVGVIPNWPYASDYLLRRETAGGGVLFDFGAHVLDLLLWWLGPPRDVAMRDDARGGLESNCEIDVAYEGGLEGRVELSRTRNLRNEFVLTAQKGSLAVELWSADPLVRLRATEENPLALEGHAAAAGRGGDFASVFDEQLDDFCAAVRGVSPSRASGMEGLECQRLIARCAAAPQPLLLPWSVR
jgi:predicted dehydrogenase